MADTRGVPAVSERDMLTQRRGMQIRTPTQELPGGEWTCDRLLRLAEGKACRLLDATFGITHDGGCGSCCMFVN